MGAVGHGSRRGYRQRPSRLDLICLWCIAMMDWFRSKPKPHSKLKSVAVGDGNLTVDLPEHFTVEQIDDATIAYDPAYSSVMVRFSTRFLSLTQDGNAKNLGAQAVRAASQKFGKRVITLKDRCYFSFVKPPQEGDGQAEALHWMAGLDNSILIVTVTVGNVIEHDAAGQVIDTVEPAIRSLRASRIQKMKPDGDRRQEITTLLPAHAERLQQWRRAAVESAKATLGRSSFAGGDSDLQVIQSVLDHLSFDQADTLALEGLGIIMGDVLARKLDLRWVTMTQGTESMPALQYQESGILMYPRDLIVKRIERGETVDVMDLFNTLVEHVRGMVASARHD
jgi:hypothetical protein